MKELIYYDRDIAVCCKAGGTLSQPAEGKSGGASLIEKLALRLSEQGEGTALYPVHRLDRPTAGLIVYARTQQAAAALSRAIGEGRLEKEYLAAVEGRPTEAAGEMRDLLYFDRKKDKSYVVSRPRAGVKEALLAYRVLATRPDLRPERGANEAKSTKTPAPCVAKHEVSLLSIRLKTGRTHQIRVQCASRGLPLVGDRRYGATAGGALALFSCRLAFPHPRTGEQMEFVRTPREEEAFATFRDLL